MECTTQSGRLTAKLKGSMLRKDFRLASMLMLQGELISNLTCLLKKSQNQVSPLSISGGFIAPFQEMSGKGPQGPFDFRLKNVLSISASGHKFGESICGTGWIVFRERENLAEHIAITVT